MILLFDIGNTNTHLGLANARRVIRQADVPTRAWLRGEAPRQVRRFVGRAELHGAALCSVVPQATPLVHDFVQETWRIQTFELTCRNVVGLGVDYPRPETIGPDRLANAAAARRRFGAPVVILDFGTALTFDVVNAAGNYVGGIIAPGLSAMTDYLHERTALLPPIHIREVRRAIGRSTEEAMLIGAVRGYRGLVRELLAELKRELKAPRLPVVATGGYATLMARALPEIGAVDPNLTLEGLRLSWSGDRGQFED
jgi:type III pantothenate kinase